MNPERAEGAEMIPPPEAGREPRLTVFHLYFILAAARFLASLLLNDPIVFSDELTYKSMALGFFSSGTFSALRPDAIGAPTTLPYVFYPLWLSMSFLFGENFLIAGKLLNALMINAAIFPFYGILRDFLPRRRAVWAAALPLLLPSFGFSAFLMAENAFMPLAATLLFLLYRQFTRRRPLDAVLSCVVLALLFLTKNQAAAYLLAVPAAAATLLAGRRARRADPGRAGDILTALGTMALAAAAAVAVLEIVLPGSLRRLYALSRGTILGAAASLRGTMSGDIGGFARAGAAHVAVFMLLFLVPALVTLWTWMKSRRSADRRRAVLTTLVLWTFLASLLMTVLATSSLSGGEAFARLHGRFYAAALPFFLIVFMAFRRDIAWTTGKRLTLGISAAATSALAAWAVPGFLTGPLKSALAVDFPELGWAAFAGPLIPAAVAVLFVLASAAVLITRKTRAWLLFLLAVLAAANIVQYRTFVRNYQPDRSALKAARSFVAGQIADPRARVAVFSRGELARGLLTFWHPYRYTRSAEIPRDGVLRRDMIPAGTEFVVIFGEWRLDFRPFRAAHQAGCSVLVLTELVSVLKDFVGVHHDAPGWTWTGPTFSYFPNRTFRSLVLVLNERRPYFPKILDIESDQGARRIRLDRGLERIELPYSNFYRFRLDRAFSPRRLGLNKDDARALGISLREAFIRD